jgi:hypothetical protein
MTELKYQYFIYKIYNPECDYVYVGSTRNMAVRKKSHKSNCNNVNSKAYNLKVYKTIRGNDGFENWYMVTIEVMDNVTKLQAEMREDVYRVDLNATMNSKRASCGGITKQEYYQQYYQDNREYYDEYNKQYYQDNKEQLSEQKKQYYQDNKQTISECKNQYRINNKNKINQKHDCDCGGKYTQINKAQHMKSKKHQKYISTL